MSAGRVYPPEWLPGRDTYSGRRAVFTSSRGGSSNVYLVDWDEG